MTTQPYSSAPWTDKRCLSILFIASITLFLPSLLGGVAESDSSRYNFVWTSQFDDLILHGYIYPRWLPQSFKEFGSPAFVFYPPFVFFVSALINILTLNDLPVPYVLALSSTATLWLSGSAMLYWLRPTVSSKTAVAFSIAYMAAPYHLTDHYWRGAMAESSVYVALPLVMASLRKLANDHTKILRVAWSIALLFTSHLPTALISMATVVPCYVTLLLARSPNIRTRKRLGTRLVISVGLGLCATATYLLPAISLQSAVLSAQLWRPEYQPERWFLSHPAAWPSPQFMAMLACFALAIGAASLGSIVVAWSSRLTGVRSKDIIFWACSGLVFVGLMAGVLPAFWTEIPFMNKVQFPWRILALGEFAALTSLAMTSEETSVRSMSVIIAPALLLALPGLATLAVRCVEKYTDARTYWQNFQLTASQDMPDASEYLPIGFPERLIGSAAAPIIRMPASIAIASCIPRAIVCQATKVGADGTLLITIKSNAATAVDVGRFYFPSWQAETADGRNLRLTAAYPYRNIEIHAPPGEHTIKLFIGMTWAEYLGWTVSACALILSAWIALSPHQRRSALAQPPVAKLH